MKNANEIVKNYFEENKFSDMMDYGESGNEGLGDMSNIVADCLEACGHKPEYHYAEESTYGDGKYDVTVGFSDWKYTSELSAWNGVEQVVNYINSVLKKIEHRK